MTDPVAKSIYEDVPLPLGMFIRVLRIRPSDSPDHLDPVACDFHLLNLDDESLCDFGTNLRVSKHVQKYTSLSYTWGDASPLHTIIVNDRPLQVRQNLWRFLQRARKNELAEYLWVDALCIDQEQLQERNHQVWLMGKIYSCAERVIVWLGAVSERVESAMQAIERTRDFWWDSNANAPHARGVFELYGLAYWSRAWIVQEYVLAHTLAIWCETLHIDGDCLRSRGDIFADWRCVNYPASRVIEARSRRRSAGLDRTESDRTILGLLSLFCQDLHCSDPRDRIYSLLSLLDSTERARLAVTPDYSKSTSDLFACIVRSFHISLEVDRASDFTAAILILASMLRLDAQDQVVKEAQMVIDASRGGLSQYTVYEGELFNDEEEPVPRNIYDRKWGKHLLER
jgi:hypothetical protein